MSVLRRYMSSVIYDLYIIISYSYESVDTCILECWIQNSSYIINSAITFLSMQNIVPNIALFGDLGLGRLHDITSFFIIENYHEKNQPNSN